MQINPNHWNSWTLWERSRETFREQRCLYHSPVLVCITVFGTLLTTNSMTQPQGRHLMWEWARVGSSVRDDWLFVKQGEILGRCREEIRVCEEIYRNLSCFLQSVGVHTSTHSLHSSLPAYTAADVVVTYMPDAQREFQDVVSTGCPQ